MALTKQKKNEIVSELMELLSSSKMTVVTKYEGTTVKAMQQIRRSAEEKGTTIKVIKNRLVIKAVAESDKLKNTDTSALKGMLLYAFNSDDEVAPAQVLFQAAKTEPQLEFVGAITSEGVFIGAEEVKALAQLPSREQLIAGVINTLQSPVRNVMGALGGNLHGLLDAVAAKKATN
jgi:large subunit ribosomal protein L10